MTSFINNSINMAIISNIDTVQNKCRKYNGFLPNKNPVISSLSNYTSTNGIYIIVYINGQNFTPYGSSVNFGLYKSLPIVFYNSFCISFVVPNVPVGNYNIQVTSNNNSNYNPALLYSNTVSYTIV